MLYIDTQITDKMLRECVVITCIMSALLLVIWIVRELVVLIILAVYSITVVVKTYTISYYLACYIYNRIYNFVYLLYMLSNLQFVDLETSADPICVIFYIFCFATICEIKKNLPRNALQRREQRSPGKETCGCTPMDMTALNKIDHVGEQPTTQPYKRNMYTDNLKKGPPKQKACNTRSMDTTALNQIHHVEEQPSTQYYNRNMHKNDKKQRPRNEKVWNTRPINTTGHNELHHLEEQPTAQSYNTNVHTNDQKQQRQRQAQEQLDEQIQRRADEIFRQSQHEGQVCKLNCAPLAIRWICNNKTEVKIPVHVSWKKS